MLRIMSDMNICVGSDGYNFSYDRTITCTDPHPRSFGTSRDSSDWCGSMN